MVMQNELEAECFCCRWFKVWLHLYSSCKKQPIMFVCLCKSDCGAFFMSVKTKHIYLKTPTNGASSVSGSTFFCAL